MGAPNFSEEERAIVSAYFSNVDDNVFSIVHLPEETKAALFARYSRSAKSLRRLFLDEFYDSADDLSDSFDATTGKEKASSLFSRVLAEYGDDSVAQLGAVHISFEAVSNLATKVLERPRLMSYLEQSTRYIRYDDRDDTGRYRYHTPAEFDSHDRHLYQRILDELFESYRDLTDLIVNRLSGEVSGEVPQAMRATMRAKALDLSRGLLPTATTSNVGIFGSAQALEQLALHLLSDDLGECRVLGEKLRRELSLTVPALTSRLEREERREPWVDYLRSTRRRIPLQMLDNYQLREGSNFKEERFSSESDVKLVRFDPDGERRVIAAILFESTSLSFDEIEGIVDRLSRTERSEVIAKYCGDRENRRHRPSRAFEATSYRFEVECDYGAFRDLQRHRLMSIEWQRLGTQLGFFESQALSPSEKELYRSAISSVEDSYEYFLKKYGIYVASYMLPMASKVRFQIDLNLRQLLHIVELRTQPQGHESYRMVGQKMFNLLKDVARHDDLASAFVHVDLTEGIDGRLKSIERELNKGR
ncbi:MAG: FAD-dependent thymidylate synthase [Actinomycetota bacterium]|nr:FAD-dependent thymidylate synthase [Actinomycetota bacterium]